jgi:hypothetical protein
MVRAIIAVWALQEKEKQVQGRDNFWYPLDKNNKRSGKLLQKNDDVNISVNERESGPALNPANWLG